MCDPSLLVADLPGQAWFLIRILEWSLGTSEYCEVVCMVRVRMVSLLGFLAHKVAQGLGSSL